MSGLAHNPNLLGVVLITAVAVGAALSVALLIVMDWLERRQRNDRRRPGYITFERKRVGE